MQGQGDAIIIPFSATRSSRLQLQLDSSVEYKRIILSRGSPDPEQSRCTCAAILICKSGPLHLQDRTIRPSLNAPCHVPSNPPTCSFVRAYFPYLDPNFASLLLGGASWHSANISVEVGSTQVIPFKRVAIFRVRYLFANMFVHLFRKVGLGSEGADDFSNFEQGQIRKHDVVSTSPRDLAPCPPFIGKGFAGRRFDLPEVVQNLSGTAPVATSELAN